MMSLLGQTVLDQGGVFINYLRIHLSIHVYLVFYPGLQPNMGKLYIFCFVSYKCHSFSLEYSESLTDPACTTGSGSIQDSAVSECTSTPFASFYSKQQPEVNCIFPYYYNNVRYDGCIIFNEDEQLLPVFRCPIMSIKVWIINLLFVSSLVMKQG